MKYILPFLLGLQLIADSVRADPVLITLDKGFTWKSMFDAGFRPYHDGDGICMCKQSNVHVQIRKQEGGEILDLGNGDVNFSLREGHLLDMAVFYGRDYRTVAEVEDKSRGFSRVFGNAVTQKAKIAWFEVKHSVDYGGRKIDPPKVTREVDDKDAVNGADVGDISIVYSFSSANAREKPMVEVFSFSLGPKVMKTRRLKTKIKPPVGYEYVSLEPVLAETNRAPTAGPEKPAEITRPGPTLGPANSTAPPSPSSSERIATKSRKYLPWLWIIGAIFFLFVVAGVLFKVKGAGDDS